MTDQVQAPYFIPPGAQLVPGSASNYELQAPLPINGNAQASMIIGGSSLALLFTSMGLLAPLTLVASIVGTWLGNRGKEDFDEGRAVQQRDLAVAGFWVGISGVILACLALLAWGALIVFLVSVDPGNNPTFEGSGTNIPSLPPELQ